MYDIYVRVQYTLWFILSCIIGSGGGGASLYRRSVVKVDRRGGGGVRHKYRGRS